SSKPQADAQATFQACLNSGDEKERRPAFLFYYKDWLSDSGVNKLSRAEKGFYIDLLCYLFQEEGYLYAPEKLEDGDILEMMNTLKQEGENVINKLLRVKCLYRNEQGYIYNKRMVREIEIYKAKQEAGRKGGKQARANERASKVSSKTQANFKQTSSKPQADSEADAQAKSNIAVAVAVADNKKNITQARAREGSSEEEKNGYLIEPPPGMPKSLEEAISMGSLAGASESFVRDRAYPQALACGWMLDGNRTIRNFGAWAKLFEDNSKNAQKRKEVADRNVVKPSKTLGQRRMEAEPWLYDKDIKVREL
ncbi:MAG: DUF1376 domain-containing protein, partial [Negativicutes bacterium]|nr:DUF1376 domain-containing protein [Negativicutes bacterium]